MGFKQLVESKGLTIYKVSKLSKVSQATLSQLSNKKRLTPRMDTLIKIAGTLNVTVDDLCKSLKE